METQALIGKEELQVLAETRNLLEELLETLDILADEESVKKLEEAKEDVREGRLYGFEEL